MGGTIANYENSSKSSPIWSDRKYNKQIIFLLNKPIFVSINVNASVLELWIVFSYETK